MNKNKTHLIEFCERGARSLVEFVIEKGAEVDEKDKNGFTALHFACMYGYKDIVELLIQNGAEIKHIEPGLIKNPLMLACENGHKDVVESLIQSGFDVESDKISEPNSLHIACLKGYRSIAELLLQVGYQFVSSNDLDHKYSKEKLLLQACTKGHLEIVKLLLETETNVTDTDSPFYRAIYGGFIEIVEFLLANGAEAEFGFPFGTYFLDLAETRTENIYIIVRNAFFRHMFKVFNNMSSPTRKSNIFFEYQLIYTMNLRICARTLAKIVKRNDFYLGYDKLRNEGVLNYFQSENFLNKLKQQLKSCENLLEKTNINNNEILKNIDSFDGPKKLEFDRQLTKLEQHQLANYKHIIELINLLNDEQTKNFIFGFFYSNFMDLKMKLSELTTELRKLYILITDEKVSSFLRFEKAIDVDPNEIKKTNNYQRVYGKRSPLIIACENNNIPLVQHIIIRGEDKNVRDFDGKTPLMKACFMKNFELAQMLLQLGADVQIEDENGENAAFFINDHFDEEIKQGDLAYQVFTMLLNTKKIDINKPNKFGETLLFFACYRAHLDIVKFLVENGLNCKIDSVFIQRSVLYESWEICEYLFDKAPEILDLKDIDEPYTDINCRFVSLLDEIFRRDTYTNRSEEFIRLLHQKGYLKDIGINRLLNLACSKNFGLIQYFVEQGADINLSDADGNSVLMLAILHYMDNENKIIKFLVENGANVNHLNNLGENSLYFACALGRQQICEYLLEKGAEYIIQNKNGAHLYSLAPSNCRYLLFSHLILHFYDLFQRENSSTLPEKVIKSIENKELKFIDYFNAFKLIHAEEDQVAKLKELRNERILEYFTSFDFREKFVTDVLINLKDKLELLNIGKIKIETNFPQIKRPFMEKFNLRVKKSQPGLSIISVDSFMEKFHEHKVLNEVNFEDESEQTGQSKETNMIFLELEELLLGDNLFKIINNESNNCAKLNKAFFLYKKINYYGQEVERMLEESNKLFDILKKGVNVDKGVNVNQCNETGDSPLILASKNTEENFESIIRFLVENGANVNHLNKSGKSAIYYTCKNDSFQISEYLIQKGADLSIHSKNGESLFSKAGFNCKYLLCADVIRQFYNLFQSQNDSNLREKVVKSAIENSDLKLNNFLVALQLIYKVSKVFL